MKKRASILVLVALLALMAASGASAREVGGKPAKHVLVKKGQIGELKLAHHSARALAF